MDNGVRDRSILLFRYRPTDARTGYLAEIGSAAVSHEVSLGPWKLLDGCDRDSVTSLRSITSMSEVLEDEPRAACDATLGVPVHDIDSAQKLGIAALQFSFDGGYHVMS